MLKSKCSKIALLGGILVGLSASAIAVGNMPAFMGTRPDEAIKMDTLKWLDENDPKFKSAAMKPRENFIELQPSSIWFGPARCHKFHLGPRYTKCLLKEEEVKPTELPYPEEN